MAQAVGFWIVFGVAAFGWALAVQMRMLIARVLRISVEAQHGDLHPNDVRAIVRAAPADAAPDGLPETLNQVRVWVKGEHPQAIAHLAKARRWSMILPIVVLVIVMAGRFGLGVI